MILAIIIFQEGRMRELQQVVNIKYCQHCGGVTQWKEFDPTVTVSAGNRIVKPDRSRSLMNYANYEPGMTAVFAQRVCQCSTSYVDTIY